jgi:hypothetical protein
MILVGWAITATPVFLVEAGVWFVLSDFCHAIFR